MQNLVSEDRKGVVLPIASVGGLAGAYHVPLYIASKHAIVGFVKSMKQAEAYEGIKVRQLLDVKCVSRAKANFLA